MAEQLSTTSPPSPSADPLADRVAYSADRWRGLGMQIRSVTPSGVARLALETGVPVVPGGVRFPNANPAQPVNDAEPFRVRFGPSIRPVPGSLALPQNVSALHAQIMGAISTLSGKEWQPDARRTKYALAPA